jgi:hypothetical protein
MLRHPGSLKETVESIERDPRFDVNNWWVIQYQIAVPAFDIDRLPRARRF